MEKANKKKMNPDTKAKLIYTTELGVFSALFVVLGILFLLEIIGIEDWKRILFTWLTLVGGVLITADFVWALVSPKRRAKVSLLDKILILPVAIALMVFDVYALITNLTDTTWFRYIIGIDFLYLALSYAVQAVYHWFHPVPGLLEEVAENTENPAENPPEK